MERETTRTPIQWGGRGALVLAATALVAGWLGGALLAPLFGRGPSNLGPLPALIVWVPLGLVAGFALGWLAARALSKPRDVALLLGVSAAAFGLAAAVLPLALGW